MSAVDRLILGLAATVAVITVTMWPSGADPDPVPESCPAVPVTVTGTTTDAGARP